MEAVFLKLVNMSISASWLVLAVLLFRVLLKKAPSSIRCALWALVAVRLLCPFSVESVLSLLPSAETLPEEFLYAAEPQINSGVSSIDQIVNPPVAAWLAPAPLTSANPTQIFSFIFSRVWVMGIAVMLLYALASCLILHRKVSAAIPAGNRVWLCDYIDSPFILGVFFPRIYLPSTLDGERTRHILAHEKAHLARKDHWWKPLGFCLLAVYWFNPVLWAAYILLCRDIELACDEKVIRQMENEDKAAYSRTLLECSVPRHLITACPLAFGEVGVKARVKAVLNYKKPRFWVILAAVVATVVLAVCFLTDPVSQEEFPETCQFRATVLEVQGSSPLVEPAEGEAERNSSDRIYLRLPEGCSMPQAGDVILVTYDGLIMETYPAQINASAIEILESAPTPTESEPSMENAVSEGWILPLESAQMDESLAHAVQDAILAHNETIGSYYAFSEATTLLGCGAADENGWCGMAVVTCLVMKQDFTEDENGLQPGVCQTFPVKIYFDCYADGKYVVTDYWQSHSITEGNDIVTSIDLNPQEGKDILTTIDIEALLAEQEQESARLKQLCTEQAAALSHAIDRTISYRLDNLCSAHHHSSPAGYIEAHPEDYELLINLGRNTLEYCFDAFLDGGQTDLRGTLMCEICKTIITQKGGSLPEDYDDGIYYANGQEWFQAYRAHVEKMSPEEIAADQPASILHSMTATE